MNIDRKRESFRMQIRRRGLDFDFKLKRKDETPVTPQQACQTIKNIFPQLQSPTTSQQLSLLIKRFREVVPYINSQHTFTTAYHMPILYNLQHRSQLDDTTLLYVHQILMHLTCSARSVVDVRELCLNYLEQNRVWIIERLIIVIGNTLCDDTLSANSVYYLLTKGKVMECLNKLMFMPTYPHLEDTHLWFTFLFLSRVKCFGFKDVKKSEMEALLLNVYSRIKNKLMGTQQPMNFSSTCWILREFIKYHIIELDDQLLNRLFDLFDVNCEAYLKLISAITYQFPQPISSELFQVLLHQLVCSYTHEYCEWYIKIINNDLRNDSSRSQEVMKKFIFHSSEMQAHNLYPLTAVFAYYLQNIHTASYMYTLVCTLIQLGEEEKIFDQCEELLLECEEMLLQ